MSEERTKKDEVIGAELEAEMASEGWTRVGARVAKSPRAVYGLRLSPEEMEAFSAAAEERHMNLADFLRSSAWAAIAGQTDPTKAAAAAKVREKARELVEAASQL